jgi:ketosteroid isomerase-like protein
MLLTCDRIARCTLHRRLRFDPAARSREASANAIRDNEDAWNNDFVAKGVSKLQAHYTDDTTLMAPGMRVAKNGDFGYSEGTYTMSMTDPVTRMPTTDKGSYVTVYTKQTDGAWKAVSDIASSEAPPAPPAK